MKFLATSLPKLHQFVLLNVIPYPLETYFSLLLFFPILVAPNKLFLRYSYFKLIVRVLGQAVKSQTMKTFKILVK